MWVSSHSFRVFSLGEMLLVEWSRSCFYLKVSGAAKSSSVLGATWKILRCVCGVCLHVGVCSLNAYVHLCISIYICVHVCMFICISVCLCVCLHMCACVYVYECVYVCVREWEDALGF